MAYIVEDNAGYLTKQRPSPFGLGAAIAVHAGVLAVLLLMPGQEIVKDVWTTLSTHNVPMVPPPDPVTEPPKSDIKAEKTFTIPTDPTVLLPHNPDLYVRRDPLVIPDPTPIDLSPTNPLADPIFVDVSIDPRYQRNFQPDYPPALMRAEREGKVTVRVRIGTNGRVLDIAQVGTSENGFWQSTRRQALGHWRFRPATRDGVPVESETTLTVHFRMNG